jgi:hypothetical protein
MILFYIILKVAWVMFSALAWICFWLAFGMLWLMWSLFTLPFRVIGGMARG